MNTTACTIAAGAIFLALAARWAFSQTTRPGTTKPANSAVVPVSKLEDDAYDWHARHKAVLEAKKGFDPEIVLIGDSITHFWGGDRPKEDLQRGPGAWKKLFAGRRVLNLGFGWDRTQNVLWRLDHEEFDGLKPRYVVINIGTNNLTGTSNARENTPAEIAEGTAEICKRVRAKSPNSKIVLMGVFPRGQKADDPLRPKIAALNKLLADYAKSHEIIFLDIGSRFLEADGSISAEIMGDGVHPTERGYAIWAEALQDIIKQ
jgi:lysophospholipase L1-like esterase